jgi:hypothetical protein
MIRVAVRGVLLMLAAGTLAAAPNVAGARQTTHALKHGFGHGTSTNWSGYAVDGTSATFVTGSWTQPASTNCSLVPNSWSSPWVGIDGDNSNTVEQTGTDSDCVNGVPYYYAWWEMYPKSTVVIPGFTVTPGHAYTATVQYGGSGQFTMTLVDNTTGARFSITETSKRAKRSSVEWIMEGPSSGNLTGFGSVSFTSDSATIGGLSVTPASSSADPITMVTKQGTDRAVPTLNGTKGDFGVTWEGS